MVASSRHQPLQLTTEKADHDQEETHPPAPGRWTFQEAQEVIRATILERLREPSSKAAIAVLLALVLPPELAGGIADLMAAGFAVWAIVTPEGRA